MPLGEDGFINIHFELAGYQEVNRRLVDFGQQVQTLAPAWEEIGNDLLQDFADQFESEGLVFGGWSEWPLLADSTVLDRERKGYGGEGPILVREGYLKESVTVRDAINNIFEVGDNQLVVGTMDEKAPYHQFGTVKMPARPIVGLSWYRQEAIVDRLNKFIADRIAESGLAE